MKQAFDLGETTHMYKPFEPFILNNMGGNDTGFPAGRGTCSSTWPQRSMSEATKLVGMKGDGFSGAFSKRLAL